MVDSENMKKFAFVALILIFSSNASIARAKVSDWQKGASIYPRSPSDFGSGDMEVLLKRIADDNAEYVTFIIPYYQGNHTSSVIFPGADTPTDDSIINGIEAAHDAGLAVMLKPHLDSDDTIWRANINPKNRDEWFTNYENMLTHLATIGREYHVEQICIGTELISVASAKVNPENTVRWQKIIADLRQIFPGELTYSANWGPSGSSFANEKDHIGFWQDLDYVGISAYFQLNTKDNSVESLKAAWYQWDRADIYPLAQKVQKPILFTEIGYRSSKNSLGTPYDFRKIGVYDPQEQVNAYEAMFEYWNDKSYIAGASIWDFYSDPHAGGDGNTDYTPQNKPAEEVLKKWFAPKANEVQATAAADKKTMIHNMGSFLRELLIFHFMTI
jgi:hypothetical protein